MKNLLPLFIQEKFRKNTLSGTFPASSLFVDISGFTRITEVLVQADRAEGSEVLSSILKFYFSPMVNAVYGHQGWVTHFAGDAFTALFPSSTPNEKNLTSTMPAKHALAAAVEISQFLCKHPVYHTKYGDFELSVKIGLALGEVDWGIVGSSDRKTYFFKGPAIDDCVRVEKSVNPKEIGCSIEFIEQVADLISEKTKCRGLYRLDSIALQKLPELLEFQYHDIEDNVLETFFGGDVLTFQQPEFRTITPVFIAFENVCDLDQFVGMVLQKLTIFGGFISRMDFGDKGGNLLFFFGVPIAYENIVERALQFVMAIKGESVLLQEGQQVKFRAGITMGLSYCGFNGSDVRSEFTCLGNAVNQSARFLLKAAWGQVLVDFDISRNQHFDFTFLGNFPFKGRELPIPTFALCGQKSGKITHQRGKMVGREHEFMVLKNHVLSIFPQKGESAVFSTCDTRFAGVFYVDGLPGIGKSRLVSEIHRFLDNEGREFTWFHLPCDDILRTSFNPVISFLKNYFDQSEQHSPEKNKALFEHAYNQLIHALVHLAKSERTHNTEGDQKLFESTTGVTFLLDELRRTKSILGALINLYWEGSLYEQLEPQLRYENILYAVKNLILAESLLQPVIIELEDSHWLDNDSKKFFSVLTRSVEKYPFVIISTCRFLDDASLFDLALKDVQEKRITLKELRREGVTAIITETLAAGPNSTIPQQTVDFFVEKGQGNPFYIEQICLYLKENSLFNPQWELLNTAFEIPASITSILIARIDRLSQKVKDVVKAAAVIGREFEIKLLSTILKSDVRQQVSIGEQEQIWAELSDLNYIFKHALLKDAVYAMQVRARLRELHQLTAHAIEDLYKHDLSHHYSDLAWHYDKAEMRDKTIEYLEKAGDYARKNYQNLQAIDYYDRTLKKLAETKNTEKLYGEIILKEVELLDQISAWDKEIELLEEGIEMSKKFPSMLMKEQFTVQLGWVFCHQGRFSEATQLYQEAIDTLTKDTSRKSTILYAKTLNGLASIYYRRGDYDNALEQFLLQKKICKKINDHDGYSRAVGNLGVVYHDLGDFERATQCYEKLIALSEKSNDKYRYGIAYNNLGGIYQSRGNIDKALECFEIQKKVSKELGNKSGFGWAVGNMGYALTRKGQYSLALEYLEEQLKITEETGDIHAYSWAMGHRALIFKFLGEYDKALESFMLKKKITEELGDKVGLCIVLANISQIYKENSEYAKALLFADEAINLATTIGLKFILAGSSMDKAEVLFIEEKYTEARDFMTQGLEIAREIAFHDKIIQGEILDARLEFTMGNKKEAIHKLERLLEKTRDDESVALLHVALYVMKKEHALYSESEKHRLIALRLYQKLCEKLPKIEYKRQLTRLHKETPGDVDERTFT